MYNYSLSSLICYDSTLSVKKHPLVCNWQAETKTVASTDKLCKANNPHSRGQVKGQDEIVTVNIT